MRPVKFMPVVLTVKANTHLGMHENDLFDIFPEFSKVVHILAKIPATSCSAERSFSALRRLKTYLCSTMGQQRVSNIALIKVHLTPKYFFR